MNDDVLTQVVLEVLAEVLEVDAADVRAEPVLAHHGWDSLSSLHAMTELESRTGVTYDLRGFHAAHTVDALVLLTCALTTEDREHAA